MSIEESARACAAAAWTKRLAIEPSLDEAYGAAYRAEFVKGFTQSATELMRQGGLYSSLARLQFLGAAPIERVA